MVFTTVKKPSLWSFFAFDFREMRTRLEMTKSPLKIWRIFIEVRAPLYFADSVGEQPRRLMVLY